MDGQERTYGRKARIVVAVLVGIAAVTAVVTTAERGFVGAIEGLVFLAITLLLGYGVYTNTLETPPIQAAFGVGLGVYGAILYVTGGSLLWLGLAVVGGGLALSNAREALQTRQLE